MYFGVNYFGTYVGLKYIWVYLRYNL